MTSATSSIGSVYKVGDGGNPETFSIIGEVLSIEGPDITASDIDVTNLGSPGFFREFIKGLNDAGGLEISFNWTNSAEQQALRDLSTTVTHRVEFSDGTIFQAGGFLSDLDFTFDPSSQVVCITTMKLATMPVWSETGGSVNELQALSSGIAQLLQIISGGVPDDAELVGT